jgi:hypothetical protein
MSLIGLQLKLVQAFLTHLQFCEKGLKHLQVHKMSSQGLKQISLLTLRPSHVLESSYPRCSGQNLPKCLWGDF